MDIVLIRARAVLLALCTIAVAAVWAPPPAEAATCQAIPVSVPGTDVTVNGEDVVVPDIDNMSLCADTGDVPDVVVSNEGRGLCQSSCLSVLVTGGIDSPGLTLSFEKDGSLQSYPLDPGGVPPAGDVCLFSFGVPDAPYQDTCRPGVAVGPNEFPGQDLVDAAVDTVSLVIATAEQIIEDTGPVVDGLVPTACNTIPPMTERDQWGYETEVRFCDEPGRWAAAAARLLNDEVGPLEQYLREQVAWAGATACATVPPAYQRDQYGNQTEVRLCDQPVEWTIAQIASYEDDVAALEEFVLRLVRDAGILACNTVPPMYEYDSWGYPYHEVRFCENPAGWATVAANNSYRTTCATVPPMYDDWGNQVRFCDDMLGWTGYALRPIVDAIPDDLCLNPRCIDPITIYFILDRLP